MFGMAKPRKRLMPISMRAHWSWAEATEVPRRRKLYATHAPSRPKMAPEAADEIHGQEAGLAEGALDEEAEQVQRVHVESDVKEAGVQEHHGDQPPVLV